MVLQVTCVFVSCIHAVILSCSVDADQCVGGVATIIFLIFHLFIFLQYLQLLSYFPGWCHSSWIHVFDLAQILHHAPFPDTSLSFIEAWESQQEYTNLCFPEAGFCVLKHRNSK